MAIGMLQHRSATSPTTIEARPLSIFRCVFEHWKHRRGLWSIVKRFISGAPGAFGERLEKLCRPNHGGRDDDTRPLY